MKGIFISLLFWVLPALFLPNPALARLVDEFEPVWDEGKKAAGPSGGGAVGGGEAYRDPSTGMELVLVKGGCYQMGSPSSERDRGSNEDPRHEVCVDDFYLGKYEVTNAQFRQFRSSHNSGQVLRGPSLNGDRQPVVEVSWEDAQAYIKWLNAQTGKNYRLPTEAEWEYAARGGTSTSRYWGDNSDRACEYANVADQMFKKKWSSFPAHNCNDGYAATSPVGSFKANAYGLHDMQGNVWEWCQDRFDHGYYGKSPRMDPQGPPSAPSGAHRVLRGGSWDDDPRYVRAASRSGRDPGYRRGNLGFRLALPPDQ